MMKTYQYTHLLPVLEDAVTDPEIKNIPVIYDRIEQLRQSILANENGKSAAQIQALNQILVLYMLQHHKDYPREINTLVNVLRQLQRPPL